MSLCPRGAFFKEDEAQSGKKLELKNRVTIETDKGDRE
jgi:hypothetical protein